MEEYTHASKVPNQFPVTAVTKHHTLGGLNSRHLSLPVPKARSPKSSLWQGCVLSGGSPKGSFCVSCSLWWLLALLGLWLRPSLVCLHTAFSSMRLSVLSSSIRVISLVYLPCYIYKVNVLVISLVSVTRAFTMTGRLCPINPDQLLLLESLVM